MNIYERHAKELNDIYTASNKEAGEIIGKAAHQVVIDAGKLPPTEWSKKTRKTWDMMMSAEHYIRGWYSYRDHQARMAAKLAK